MRIIILLLLFASCSSVHESRSHAKAYAQAIYQNQCEEAQNAIPLEKDNSQFIRFYQGTMGYMISIPMIAVMPLVDFYSMGRCQYGGCTSRDKSLGELLFPTTNWTYEATKDLRCPDHTYYLHKFVEVASCYEKRNDEASLIIAYSQLSSLNKAYDIGFTCTQNRDAQVIKEQLSRVKEKLQSFDSYH